MRVILCGALGRMGREMQKQIARSGKSRVVAAVDRAFEEAVGARSSAEDGLLCADCKGYAHISEVQECADVIVDFSHHSAVRELVDFAGAHGLPLVIATTGHTEEEREYITRASKDIPIFFCGNMSLGVALFVSVVAKVAGTFPYADVEIIETHRKGKADAPSGTALMLANAVIEARGGEGRIVIGRRDGERQTGDIGISSVRMGDVVGEHEVRINTGFQTITLKHEAHSRAIFAIGAVRALDFICTKQNGLYSVKDFL